MTFIYREHKFEKFSKCAICIMCGVDREGSEGAEQRNIFCNVKEISTDIHNLVTTAMSYRNYQKSASSSDHFAVFCPTTLVLLPRIKHVLHHTFTRSLCLIHWLQLRRDCNPATSVASNASRTKVARSHTHTDHTVHYPFRDPDRMQQKCCSQTKHFMSESQHIDINVSNVLCLSV